MERVGFIDPPPLLFKLPAPGSLCICRGGGGIPVESIPRSGRTLSVRTEPRETSAALLPLALVGCFMLRCLSHKPLLIYLVIQQQQQQLNTSLRLGILAKHTTVAACQQLSNPAVGLHSRHQDADQPGSDGGQSGFEFHPHSIIPERLYTVQGRIAQVQQHSVHCPPTPHCSVEDTRRHNPVSITYHRILTKNNAV